MHRDATNLGSCPSCRALLTLSVRTCRRLHRGGDPAVMCGACGARVPVRTDERPLHVVGLEALSLARARGDAVAVRAVASEWGLDAEVAR